VSGQVRSTQRYRPTTADDEDGLTRAVVMLASEYGRYGYRRIWGLLDRAGWRVNLKRIARIWRREGLRVPQKHPSAAGFGWRTGPACGCAHAGQTMSGPMTSSKIGPMTDGSSGC